MLILLWCTSNLFFLTSLLYQVFASVQGEARFLLCHLYNKKCEKGKQIRMLHPRLPKNQGLSSTPECLSIRISKPRQKERSQFGLQFGNYSHNLKMPLNLTAVVTQNQIKKPHSLNQEEALYIFQWNLNYWSFVSSNSSISLYNVGIKVFQSFSVVIGFCYFSCLESHKFIRVMNLPIWFLFSTIYTRIRKPPLRQFLFLGINHTTSVCRLANKDAKLAVCGGVWMFYAEF